MASLSFNTFTNSSSPKMRWDATCSYTRSSNTILSVTLTVTGEIINHVSTSYMGTSSTGNATLTVHAKVGGAAEQTYVIKSSSAGWYGNTNNPRSCTFNFSVPSNTSGSNISVSYWVVNGGSSYTAAGAVSTQSSSFSSPAMLYTSCGAPTTVSVSDTYVAANQNLTVSWYGASSGVGNGITSYEIIRYNNRYDTWEDVTTVSSSASSGSITTSIPSTYRGYGVVFSVRARGSAGADYYSGWTNSPAIAINTIPTISSLSYSPSRIISTGESIKFSWSGYSASGNGLTYRYVLDTSATTTPSSSNSSTTSTSISINPGAKATRYFHVRAYDGYDWSDTLHVALVYNSKPSTPIISNVSWTANQIAASASFSFSATDADSDTLTYVVIKEIASLSDFSDATITSKTATSPFSENFRSEGFPGGYYIRYKVKVTDGYEESTSATTTAVRTNKAPLAPIITTISPAIYETSATITYTIQADVFSPLFSLYIQHMVEGGSWVLEATLSPVTAGTGFTYTSSYLAVRGRKVYYRAYVVDSLGYSSPYSNATLFTTRNSAPVMSGQITSDFSGMYNPWNKNQMTLTWNGAISDDNAGGYATKYSIALTYPGYSTPVVISNQETFTLSNNSASKTITFASSSALSNIITTAIPLGKRNTVYNSCYVTITPIDSFNVEGTPLLFYFNLDLKFTPVLNNQTSGIGQDSSYYLSIPEYGRITSTGGGGTTGLIPYSQVINNYPMISSGDTLSFYWKPGIDKNDGDVNEKDILTYIIEIAYSETAGIIATTTTSYTTLLSLNASGLIVNSDGFLHYDYTIPQYSKNRVCRFRIYAIDSTNLSSNKVVFPYGIEICRNTEPSVSLLGASYGAETATNSNKISAIYSLIDLGGSTINPSRTGVSYTDRRNLEIVQSSRLIKFEIQYSDSSSFVNPSIIDLIQTSNSPYATFEEQTSLTSAGIISNKTYFIRLKVSISKGSTTKIAFSNAVLLRGSEPNYTNCKSGVGINAHDPEGCLNVRPKGDANLDYVIFGEKFDTGILRFVVNLTNGKLVSGIIDSGELT